MERWEVRGIVFDALAKNAGQVGFYVALCQYFKVIDVKVQNHGGDVRVWSQAGHGSTFTIRLPRPVEQSTEPAPKKKVRA